MSVPRTVGILKSYNDLPEALKGYLQHFPKLADEFPWEVSLSYLFAQIELAQNKAVHGIIVRKHRVDTSLARRTIDDFHMTRKSFRDLYQKISGKKISKQAVEFATEAEGIRDKILHGKSVSDSEKRKAVIAALKYAQALNEQVHSDAGFRPFGDMRGFKGRAEPLDKSTSRWVLTGMGLIGSKTAQDKLLALQ